MPPAPPARRRADALRNAQAITEAAVRCLGERPEASVADIAAAAGVSRVTLYGHFPSRTELVEAAVHHVLAEADAALAELDLTGPPAEALAVLIEATWRLMDRTLGVVAAAERELTSARLLELHEQLAARPREILARGQADGSFRTDMSTSWMLATLHHLTHGAADEIARGRLSVAEAPALLTATVLAAFARPA